MTQLKWNFCRVIGFTSTIRPFIYVLPIFVLLQDYMCSIDIWSQNRIVVSMTKPHLTTWKQSCLLIFHIFACKSDKDCQIHLISGKSSINFFIDIPELTCFVVNTFVVKIEKFFELKLSLEVQLSSKYSLPEAFMNCDLCHSAFEVIKLNTPLLDFFRNCWGWILFFISHSSTIDIWSFILFPIITL